MLLMRLPWIDYWELEELPVGDLSFSTIEKALKQEVYLRKFTPTNLKNDLMNGNLSALLYWYNFYIEELYDLAANKKDFMEYFNKFPEGVKEGFIYLFPQLIKRLRVIEAGKIKKSKLDEVRSK